METPRVQETLNRRHNGLRSEIADARARAISRSAFVGIGAADPMDDVTFDVAANVADHHGHWSAKRAPLADWEATMR